jgi:hypothetical protein
MSVHIGTHLDLHQPIASRFLKWDLNRKKLQRVKFRGLRPPRMIQAGKDPKVLD